MSSSGTPQTTARNSSGRWVSAAPTSRPPFDRPEIASRAGAGDAVRDQPFGGGDEIVEHVLLAAEHAGAVPVLAVFAAAAQDGQRVDAAGLEERDRRRRPARRHAVFEAAVAGEQRGLRAVALDPLAVDEEQRQPRAVARRHHHPFDLEGAASIGACSFRHGTRGGRGRWRTSTRNDLGRHEERREPVEDLGDVARAGQPGERAQPGQRDLAARRAVRRIQAQAQRRVLQRGRRQPAAEVDDALQDLARSLISSFQRARRAAPDRPRRAGRAARRWS